MLRFLTLLAFCGLLSAPPLTAQECCAEKTEEEQEEGAAVVNKGEKQGGVPVMQIPAPRAVVASAATAEQPVLRRMERGGWRAIVQLSRRRRTFDRVPGEHSWK